MSLARVVVTAVVVEGRSKTQVARDYGVARSPGSMNFLNVLRPKARQPLNPALAGLTQISAPLVPKSRSVFSSGADT